MPELALSASSASYVEQEVNLGAFPYPTFPGGAFLDRAFLGKGYLGKGLRERAPAAV